VKLARRYHADFPDEPTMYYWFIGDTSYAAEGPLAGLLAGHPGPSVIVKDENDYWSHGFAAVLGVYSWDESNDDWALLHRGEVEY
jgi:hypothetical protein